MLNNGDGDGPEYSTDLSGCFLASYEESRIYVDKFGRVDQDGRRQLFLQFDYLTKNVRRREQQR